MIEIIPLSQEEAKQAFSKAKKAGENYHALFIKEYMGDVLWNKGFEEFLDPVVERVMKKENKSAVEAICKVYFNLGMDNIMELYTGSFEQYATKKGNMRYLKEN